MSPLILAAAGASLISFSAVFVKISAAPAAAAAFYRILAGGAVLLFMSRRDLRSEGTDRGSVFLAACCGLFICFDLTVWHISIALVGPGLATLLNNLSAVFVVVLARFMLHEKCSTRQILSLPAALGGIWLLVLPGGGIPEERLAAGALTGVLSALSYAAFIVVLKELRSHSSNSAAGVMGISSVFALPPIYLAARLHNETLVPPSLGSLAVLVCYGILCHAAGWGLLSAALGRLSAVSAAFLLLIQPGLSYVWDILFFGKAVGPAEAAGALVLVMSIVTAAAGSPVRQPPAAVSRCGRSLPVCCRLLTRPPKAAP